MTEKMAEVLAWPQGICVALVLKFNIFYFVFLYLFVICLKFMNIAIYFTVFSRKGQTWVQTVSDLVRCEIKPEHRSNPHFHQVKSLIPD